MALTDDITALGTVGAVVAAVGIAVWGNRRSDKQLREDRARSDRERRIERNVALLLEVYDLYAEFQSPPTRDVALFKLHARLAVLPWTVATLIRFAAGGTLLNDPDSKKAWVVHRAGRGRDIKPTEVGFDLLEHEFPADLWFLHNDQPFDEKRQWWFAYEQEYPPDGGNVSPGIVAPKRSAI